MLQIVANAMKREFIPHLDDVRNTKMRRHNFIVPAILDGKARIYTIDLAHDGNEYKFHYTKQILEGALTPLQLTPPIWLAGSGANSLLPIEKWMRPLLKLVKAYNNKKIKGHIVAERLARIAYDSHLRTKDGTVGPDCCVIWRNSKHSLYKGGGGQEFFSHRQRASGATIPNVSNGRDVRAQMEIILEEVAPLIEKISEAGKKGEKLPEGDSEVKEINRRVSKLPSKPDEKLH